MSAAPGSRASSSCWPTGSRSPRDTSRVPSGQVAASVTEQSLAVSSPEPCSRAAADWAASAEGGHSTSSSSPRLSQVHIGGNTALTGPRAPAEQWNCPIPEARAATVGAVPAETVTTGWTWESRGLELEVLWPPSAEAAQSAAAREHGSGDDTANDCSVTLAATWPDGTRLVSLGDLEPVGQQELLALDPGAADIVKVAHHGSRFQHEPLYQHLGASVALVPAEIGRAHV